MKCHGTCKGLVLAGGLHTLWGLVTAWVLRRELSLNRHGFLQPSARDLRHIHLTDCPAQVCHWCSQHQVAFLEQLLCCLDFLSPKVSPFHCKVRLCLVFHYRNAKLDSASCVYTTFFSSFILLTLRLILSEEQCFDQLWPFRFFFSRIAESHFSVPEGSLYCFPNGCTDVYSYQQSAWILFSSHLG